MNVYQKVRSFDTSVLKRTSSVLIAIHIKIPSKILRVTETVEQVFVPFGAAEANFLLGKVYYNMFNLKIRT